MKRPAVKPSQRINNSNKIHGDWKDNRIVVAALSAAGTATLFSTVIMPLVNTVQSNKIQQYEDIIKNAQATSNQLAQTKEELKKAKAEIFLAIQKTPLVPGSVYPLGEGFDSVVLGTDVKELKNRLSGLEKDEDGSYFSYRTTNHPVFSGSTYYQSNNKVDMILYHLHDRDGGGNLIKKTLLTHFGEPFAEKKGSMLWKIKNNEWALLDYKNKVGYFYKIQRQPYSQDWGEFLEKKK